MNSEKAQKMFSLVEQWRNSGMTQRQFCNQQDIKFSTFGYWNTRYRRSQIEPGEGFVTIDTSDAAAPPDGVEIIYPNEVRLRVGGTNRSLISQLIRAW